MLHSVISSGISANQLHVAAFTIIFIASTTVDIHFYQVMMLSILVLSGVVIKVIEIIIAHTHTYSRSGFQLRG